MWKRLQGHVREKERSAQIGNPVLLETTYDEDQLRRNPNVSDAQNANYRFNAPTQQPYPLSPQHPPNYRASEVPTASSVYSRPSHDLPYEDISPPSSPEPDQYLSTGSTQPRRFRSMRDVSPVDETRGKNMDSTRSNIPVLRKAPPALQTGETKPAQKFWGGKVASEGKVRWDEYSGEPSSAGRAGSISPGSYAKGIAPPARQPLGYQVSISGPEKRNVSFGDRVGRLGVRPPPVETAKHEPWSRATGRSQIAPPLKDQQSTKPLQLSRKALSPSATSPTDRVAGSSRAHHQGRNFSAPLATTANRVPVGADTDAVADISPNLDMHEDQIKPTVPLKIGKNSPTRGIVSPISPAHPTGLGIQTPFTPIQKERRQSPDTVIHEQSFSREIPIPERIATPPQDPVVYKPSQQTPEKFNREPSSRFSWTTYNSATTYQHSPPPSPPQPPVPTITPPRPRVVTEPISAATAASSILSRRRPVPQADRIQEPTPQPRGPSGPETPGTAKITTMSSPTTYSPSSPAGSTFSTSTNNNSKALPLPPTSLSASDHITVLESQLEDLRIRRSNVYRLLNDLNTAAPPNPLITDFKRARLVEARKRAFEDELSEIKREEHDVGLKLHRAWKKRDRENGGEGSAIWIRRVTS